MILDLYVTDKYRSINGNERKVKDEEDEMKSNDMTVKVNLASTITRPLARMIASFGVDVTRFF